MKANQWACIFVWSLLGLTGWSMSAYSYEQHEIPPWPALEPATKLISNLHVVAPGIVRGGQPTVDGLVKLKQAGVKTIINLRKEEVLTARESLVARKLGFTFYNIPLDVFNEPTARDIEHFVKLVNNTNNQPVFVHCLHGQDRTGCMIAAYRIAVENWSASKAYEEMLFYGFRPEFANLTRAVFGCAASLGRPERLPLAEGLVDDLKQRLSRLFSR